MKNKIKLTDIMLFMLISIILTAYDLTFIWFLIKLKIISA